MVDAIPSHGDVAATPTLPNRIPTPQRSAIRHESVFTRGSAESALICGPFCEKLHGEAAHCCCAPAGRRQNAVHGAISNGEATMPKSQKRWIYAPRKQAPPAVPAALKREVQEKANALVETELKPLHVTPPPEDPQFNYIEDLSTRWRGGFFYFFALYRSAGPGALGGQFESKFAAHAVRRGRAFRFGLHAPHRRVDRSGNRSGPGRLPGKHPRRRLVSPVSRSTRRVDSLRRWVRPWSALT